MRNTKKRVGATMLMEKKDSKRTKPKRYVRVIRNAKGEYKAMKTVSGFSPKKRKQYLLENKNPFMTHRKKHRRVHLGTHRRNVHHRRRRRIGATAAMLSPTGPIVRFGSVALGYLMASTLNTTIDGIMPASLKASTSYGYIAGGGELVLGALLAFKKGPKKLLPVILGGILVGAGAKRTLQAAKIVSGFRQVPVLGGYRQVPVLGGYNVPVSGYNVPAVASIQSHKQVMGGFDSGSGSGIHDESRY